MLWPITVDLVVLEGEGVLSYWVGVAGSVFPRGCDGWPYWGRIVSGPCVIIEALINTLTPQPTHSVWMWLSRGTAASLKSVFNFCTFVVPILNA